MIPSWRIREHPVRHGVEERAAAPLTPLELELGTIPLDFEADHCRDVLDELGVVQTRRIVDDRCKWVPVALDRGDGAAVQIAVELTAPALDVGIRAIGILAPEEHFGARIVQQAPDARLQIAREVRSELDRGASTAVGPVVPGSQGGTVLTRVSALQESSEPECGLRRRWVDPADVAVEHDAADDVDRRDEQVEDRRFCDVGPFVLP